MLPELLSAWREPLWVLHELLSAWRELLSMLHELLNKKKYAPVKVRIPKSHS
jgi:hypothetical protein